MRVLPADGGSRRRTGYSRTMIFGCEPPSAKR